MSHSHVNSKPKPQLKPKPKRSGYSNSFNNHQVSNQYQTDIVADPLTLKDFFEGLAQLATSGIIETTEVIEAIHREVLLRPFGRFDDVHQKKWSKGLTAKAYSTLRLITNTVGHRLAVPIVGRYPKSVKQTLLSPTLKQLVNIMNGLIGDHLTEQGNVLAVTMRLYDRYGQPQKISATHAISGRVVILVHGLCMSYLGWRPCESNGLGERIVHADPMTTVLYLDYNSGQPIYHNGRDLSYLVQNLVAGHPDINQIDLVGHSMGGLVMRSAMFYGEKEGLDWIHKVDNVITLGTPHNGALLERLGYFIQDLMVKIPFASALSTLGNIRSKGMNDLRYGSICNDSPSDDSKPPRLPHTSIPIPKHVDFYCIAGTLIEGIHDSTVSQLLGDGLVVVDSAFGDYVEEQTLGIPEHHKAVFYGVSHYNLLYQVSVHEQIIEWLSKKESSNNVNKAQLSSATRLHVYKNDLEVTM